jgi:hypothetical protein
MTEIQIKVTVDEAYMGSMLRLRRSLTRIGMKVETTMPEIGVIFGSAEESLLPRVSAARGVLTVAAEATYHVAPPETGDDTPR